MKLGSVMVPLKSKWADKHGTHTIVHDKSWYDAIAIYCPDTHACYYVRMEEIAGVCVSVRIMHSRNNQRAHVRFAEDHRDPLRLFSLASGFVDPGTPVGITAGLPRPRLTVPVPDRRVVPAPPAGV